jgi:hypothetical protein
MGVIHKFSDRMIDYGERIADIADAAEGKHRRRGQTKRWLLLPATGAALYAVVRSDLFARQAKEVVDEAKTRAAELPDDLIARVRQTTQASTSGSGQPRRANTSRRRSTASRRSSSSRRAKASSPRN